MTGILSEFCSQCGEPRDCKSSWCRKCLRAASKKNRLENIDARREYDRKYAREHKEKRRAYNKEWRKNNPEKVKAQDKKRYYKDPQKRRTNSLLWAKRNPEKHRATGRARHARMKYNGGIITANEEQELYKKYNYKCANPACDSPDAPITLDHVIPLIKGGANTIDNAQPLCKRCNSSKGRKIIDYRR